MRALIVLLFLVPGVVCSAQEDAGVQPDTLFSLLEGRCAAGTEARAPDVPVMKETPVYEFRTPAPAMPEDTQTWLAVSAAEEPEDDAPMGLSAPPAIPSGVQPLTESAPAPQRLLWPVSGTVERPYSADALSYDRTMADWRTHPAVDLNAEAGEDVLSVTGGRVTAVYADPMLGAVVEIDHGNGRVGVYANLSDTSETAVGDTVTAGQRIGGVGATALGESAQDSHLHFAMRKDGAWVDPADYLPAR